MTAHFRFHWPSLLVALGLLGGEIGIALYINDRFVRPYVGDFLVVILIYYFVKTFLAAPFWLLFWAVLFFAYFVELAQYLQLLRFLGWQNSQVARVVMGVAFEWGDMLAYTLGMLTVVAFERHRKAPHWR